MERIIKSIMVEGVGLICAEKQIDNDGRQPMGTYRIERNSITEFTKNGEMAAVNWYAQGDKEYNGKFVIEIEYYTPANTLKEE